MIHFKIQSVRFQRFLAVEGSGTLGAKGMAPGVGQQEPDHDWQPI